MNQLPPLGIIQLNTRFARPAGDISNPASWPFPIRVGVVAEATPKAILEGGWSEDTVLAFVKEGRRLIEEEGCVALVTSCGFLATMHPLLASHLPSIGSSALLQLPIMKALYPVPNSVGVICFKARCLSLKHFACVGASPQTPFTGLRENGVFSRVLNCEIPYDHDGMLQEVLEAGRELQELCRSKGGELRAVLLECTNMPPFSAAVARELNVAVYDILTLGKMIYSAAVKEEYEFRLPSPPRGM
ncbi:hypothetical protein BDY24DRAFT_382057 [Mrakia frigida]|uniref:uncharacterized protein n=1 Tax=Mrakia frigida TaxID=29902 RepID=UPI003FCC0E71